MMTRRRSLMLGAAAAIVAPRLVSAATPTVGVTLPLTGVQAEVARELELGYRMALEESGVSVRIMDDESVPDKVAANVKQLAADPSVVALSGIVGTPHAQAGLAAAKAGGLPVVGIRSGAQLLRKGDPTVFHLRASFEDEMDKMAAFCRGSGIKRMAIMYSDDSFGKSSREHLIKQLAESGIELVSDVSVDRNGENIADGARRTAQAAGGSGSTAVALLLIVKPMVAAAKELRLTHDILSPILAMSFTITTAVATSQSAELRGVGLVSAFPLPRVGVDAMQVRYRAALARNGRPNELIQSLTGYEGYFYGTVVGQAVSGGGNTRDALVRRMQSGFVLGNTRVEFTKKMVGYSYIEFLHKSRDGLLRA